MEGEGAESCKCEQGNIPLPQPEPSQLLAAAAPEAAAAAALPAAVLLEAAAAAAPPAAVLLEAAAQPPDCPAAGTVPSTLLEAGATLRPQQDEHEGQISQQGADSGSTARHSMAQDPSAHIGTARHRILQHR